MDTDNPQVIEIGGSLDSAPVITLNKNNSQTPPTSPIQKTATSPTSSPRINNNSKLTSSPKLDININKPSVNFGGGIELLMNDKRKSDGSKSPSSNTNLEDINNLENELNDLATKNTSEKTPSKSGMFKKILDGSFLSGGETSTSPSNNKEVPIQLNKTEATSTGEETNNVNSEDDGIKLKIGKETAAVVPPREEDKTWDGFKNFNNVPINPDKKNMDKPELTPEELVREKFKILRKLEIIEKKGVKLSKRYTMDSDLQEMQGEYEVHLTEKERSASVKFQGKMLMAAITGLEFLNNRFDPFDVKLDGWGEQVNENLDDYDEIFSELHEKYKSKAKMAPELKLMFQLGGSAIMVHMTNTMFKSAMPGMDDIMRQNPELMQQFTQAAASSMGEQNPGFGGFMNGLMQNRGPPPPPNVAPGPPPAPVPAENLRSQRGGPQNRPDLRRAQGNMGNMRNMAGEELESRFGSIGANRSMNTQNRSPTMRPEMRGPSDVSDLLAGLKSTNIDIPQSNPNDKDTASTVSVSDMKNMKNTGAQPVRSKRRQKSDKNVISLQL